MKQTLVKTLNYFRNNLWSIVLLGAMVFLIPSFGLAADSFVGEALVWILKGPLYLLGQLVVFLIDLLSYLFEFNNFVSVPVVTQGWIVVRDLLNMFFVLIMMLMAIATILPFGALSGYTYKSLMVKFLIAAVTINFSKTILGVMIDAGQIVMLQFVASFREAIAVNLADGAMLPEILAYADNADTGLLEAVIAMLMGIVFMVIFSFILVLYVGVLLYRIISLWVLLILSPIAFFAQAVPSMASYAKEFWSKFIGQLTIGIVLAFFMWLALTIMYMTDTEQDWISGKGTGVATQLNDYNRGGEQGGGENSVCSSEACQYYKILRFLIAIIILMMAMQYAQKSGGAAGKMAGKLNGKMMALGAGAVGGFGAAKYLKKKGLNAGKDLGKRALDKSKALGSTAWQATGGRAMTGLKNKLGTEGGKGAALASAGIVGGLLTGGALPAAALMGYGGYKMLKQAYKNRKEKTKQRVDAKRKADAMTMPDSEKDLYIDDKGNKTSSTENVVATWNKEEQAYKTKEKKYKFAQKEIKEGEEGFDSSTAKEKTIERKFYMDGVHRIYEDEDQAKFKELGSRVGMAEKELQVDKVVKRYNLVDDETKKVFEGEAGYDDIQGEVKTQESEVVTDDHGRKRQRFDEYEESDGRGKKIVRRYDENSQKFRKVNQETGEFDENDKGIEGRWAKGKWASYVDNSGAINEANKSKFGGATEKAKQEKLDKGVGLMSALDDDTLKRLVQTAGSHDDRKFAALALAKKGVSLNADEQKAANEAVKQDPNAKKQYNADKQKSGDGSNLGGNVDKITEAIEKGMLKISELKVSKDNFNSSILEAIIRTQGNKTGALLDSMSKDAKSKEVINRTMREYLRTMRKSNPESTQRKQAEGVYAKRTGDYEEAFSERTEEGQDAKINVDKLTKFFKSNSTSDVLEKVKPEKLDVPEIKLSLQKCENASLFSSTFNNEKIDETLKYKIGQIIDSGKNKEFADKLRKGKHGVYFPGKGTTT